MEPEKKKENGKESEIDEVMVMVEVAGADDDDDDDDDDDAATGQRRRKKKNGGHHRHRHQKSMSSDPGSDLKDDNSTSSSQMLGLLDEFTKIYSDRLQRVEQTAMKTTDKQYLESKVCVLESWVRDLGEQNAVLVATVEELEKEAADRVALLEDRLAKMATTTRESCVSLRDHQLQVSSLVAGKMGLEKEALSLGEKLVNLERSNMRLKEDNNNLQGDLTNLVQLITRARLTGQWEADDLTFTCVTPEQVFGPVISSSRRSSQSLKDSQRDYIHQMLEDHIKKENSSIRSSLSNIHDGDSSIYGSRGSEKDVLIMKLKADLRCSQTAHEEINCQLVERDKQIADLQAHLTEIHHELAESQAEVSRLSHNLQELRHQSKHESIEVTRKEEVLRHILGKASKKDSLRGSFSSLCDMDSTVMGDNNVEAQLSENIDILASRLAELEDECQQLRDQHSALQDTHSLCAPTINMLQDQLSRSQQMQVELRTVLTSEVAERHDQIVTLKDQLKGQEQTHHETKMQLQLRNEVIKDLRREIRELKEKVSSLSPKTSLTTVKGELGNPKKESKPKGTQTCQVDSTDKGAMTEQSAASPPNGYYSNSQLLAQVSKLQNELAEKSVLLRELQSHLSASRQEVKLKDETLYKLEQKLNATRREDGQKGERMQYLTGQLTSLQLEVGRTHGQAEHLRRQLENKNEMLQKMEDENASLTKILNEKSATLEKYQSDILRVSSDLDRKKKEVADQRLTINTLQDALVTSKRTCDELRMRLESDVSDSMLMHHSLPPQVLASCNNNNYNNLQSIHSGVTKSISSNSLASHPMGEPPGACNDSSSSGLVNHPTSVNVKSVNNHFPDTPPDGSSVSQSLKVCSSLSSSQPVGYSSLAKTSSDMFPDLRTCSESSAKNDLNQNPSCARDISVLPAVNGSSAVEPVSSLCQGNKLNGISSHGTTPVMKRVVEDSAILIGKEHLNAIHTPAFSGQVYDV